MTELEFLEGLTFGPAVDQSNKDIDYFTQNFWGEKNQGFEVLNRNLKSGQLSCIKNLQDFFRESATSEDLHAKQLTKLAKQAANSNTIGTFSPMFEVFKETSEKLSSCHMDVVSKLQEIMKELSKYLDEQKSKPKQIKDELNSTADAVHQMDHITLAVQKSKEKFHQLCIEVEKLKKANASAKDIEKTETKAKKASEDYKNSVEKYASVRKDYEQKMTDSAKKFQEIEIAHLTHMKYVLESYIFAYENASVLVSQVHQEFRKQIAENTISSLLKRFSEVKGTGTEKPGEISFEECDVTSVVASTETVQSNGVNDDEAVAVQPANKSTRRPITLPFRRKKPRKTIKESGLNGSKETDKDQDSQESQEKENSPKVDDEGFTIRSESPKESRNSWGYSSGDSDSDEDEYTMKKIHIRIKPKEASSLPSSENTLNQLNAITKNLTLASPVTMGGKRLIPSNLNSLKPNSSKSSKTSPKNKKSSADELFDLFGENSTTSNFHQFADFSDKNLTEKTQNSGKMPQSSSCASLDVLFSISPPDKSNGERSLSKGKYLSSSTINSNHSTPVLRPTNLALDKTSPEPHKAKLTSSESLSSLSSLSGTPVESFAVSRGPSPLTLSFSDPVPIAVAFTETVNALFKGLDGERCVAKVNGEVQISFPSGIIRAFTSNPNPSVLSFVIKGFSNSLNFTPNSAFLFTDASQQESTEATFWFDMTALTSHIKKMTEKSPNSPYYNVAVLSYELILQSGLSLVPLQLTSSWECDVNTTDVKINYKYNNNKISSPLKNVQFLVPVDGGVSSQQSQPPAVWNPSQNRLLWKLGNFITPGAPSGILKSKLSLTSGPSSFTSLAVQFMSEGGTVTGSDFELVGSGYRLSLIKKRFVSGKYLMNGN